MSNITTQLPIIYCTPMEFFDKLEELYIGQVIVAIRYKKEKDDLVSECFMKTGDGTYKKINYDDISVGP